MVGTILGVGGIGKISILEKKKEAVEKELKKIDIVLKTLKKAFK